MKGAGLYKNIVKKGPSLLLCCIMQMIISCGGGDGGSNTEINPDNGEIQPPSIVDITQNDDDIIVSWQTSQECHVNIEKSTDNSFFTEITVIENGLRSYTDSEVEPATEYFYRLRSYCDGSYSQYSSTYTITTESAQGFSCNYSGPENALFVDANNLCGSCNDGILKSENNIKNPWCTVSHAVDQAIAGETIFIRAGRYHESIDLTSSGTADNPITIKAFSSENVIFDGSRTIYNWKKCQSQEECNSTSWQNIYYSYIPAEHAEESNILTINLYQGNNFLAISQEPDIPDPFYLDDIDHFHTATNGLMQSTQLTESSVFNQNDSNYWNESYALLWVSHNRVNFRKINSFDPDTDTIFFDETENPPYTDRDSKFSLANGTVLIDTEGEYSLNETLEEDGSRKVFLWPLVDANPDTAKITYSALNYGININRKSYIVIDGLIFQKYTGSELIHGVGVGSVSQGEDIEQVVIRNNTMRYNRHSTRGYGGVYLSHCNNCLVENNIIHESVRQKGIFLSYPENSSVSGNTVYRAGHTCITYYYASNSKIINNDISGCSGSHANTITVYLDSDNILIANNKIYDSRGSLTLQDSSNITIYNNIIDSGNRNHCIDEWAGDSSGTYIIANNHLLNASSNTALSIGEENANYIVKNNIIDGFCPNSDYAFELGNNVYTGLSWCQSENYGWSLEENSYIQEEIELLFDNSTYTPFETSVLKNGGADISDTLPEEVFNNFNFEADFNNSERNLNQPNIGAIEN
ncbi:MAG: hypothetical protein D6B27_09975 [Gammaproteobacteria bacterium]|nr:MAG: hypothetical protein D6B27_09975 [Gammaproteobacteria bacterium]